MCEKRSGTRVELPADEFAMHANVPKAQWRLARGFSLGIVCFLRVPLVVEPLGSFEAVKKAKAITTNQRVPVTSWSL